MSCFFEDIAGVAKDEYVTVMREIMKNRDQIYEEMFKHIHGMSVVLKKKFYLLRIAYSVFIIGLCLCIATFIGIVTIEEADEAEASISATIPIESSAYHHFYQPSGIFNFLKRVVKRKPPGDGVPAMKIAITLCETEDGQVEVEETWRPTPGETDHWVMGVAPDVQGSTSAVRGTPPRMEVVESSLEQRPRMPLTVSPRFSELQINRSEGAAPTHQIKTPA